MGDRSDILQRPLERIATGSRSHWQSIAAREALAEAAACASGDAQQRLAQIVALMDEEYTTDERAAEVLEEIERLARGEPSDA